MPTYETSKRFIRDFRRLTPAQQDRFLAALAGFIDDLLMIETRQQARFRPGLRVKRVRGTLLFEMTWAPDSRATFSFEDPIRQGLTHVRWHRCGDHSIL